MKKMHRHIPVAALALGLLFSLISPEQLAAQSRHSYPQRPQSHDQHIQGPRDYSNNQYKPYYDSRPSANYQEAYHQGQFVRRISRNADRFRMGRQDFYMHQGVFFKPVRNGFVVIPAPIGLQVKRVPQNARRLDIGRNTYYEANGTYYLDIPHRHYYEIVPAPIRRARQPVPRGKAKGHYKHKHSKYPSSPYYHW